MRQTVNHKTTNEERIPGMIIIVEVAFVLILCTYRGLICVAHQDMSI